MRATPVGTTWPIALTTRSGWMDTTRGLRINPASAASGTLAAKPLKTFVYRCFGTSACAAATSAGPPRPSRSTTMYSPGITCAAADAAQRLADRTSAHKAHLKCIMMHPAIQIVWLKFNASTRCNHFDRN